MTSPQKPLVAFIEDDPSHYTAIKEHLDGIECLRLGPDDLPAAMEELKDSVPAVLAVDQMLFSSAADEAKFDREAGRDPTQGDQVKQHQPTPRRSVSRSGYPEPYLSGAEYAKALKEAWPTMRVLLYTQLGKDAVSPEEGWYEVIGKDLGPGKALRNSEEIAAKIRKMLKDHPEA